MCSRFDALAGLRAFMRAEFFVCFCIKNGMGTQVGVGWLWECFKPSPTHPQPPVVCSGDRSGAVTWYWSCSLLLCGLLYWAICFMSYLVLFCSCVFSVLLALRLTRLGKRELILVFFILLFDLRLFGFVCFHFPLGVWEGLRFVIDSLDFSLTFSFSNRFYLLLQWYTQFYLFSPREGFLTHQCNISENTNSNDYREETTMRTHKQEIAEMLKHKKTNSSKTVIFFHLKIVLLEQMKHFTI